MEQTLSNVKKLEQFVLKYGEDPFISQTITKMLGYKIQKYEEKLKKLNRAIKKFELKHQKNSSIFFQEFNKGELGDSMDFIEWASLYQMRNRLLEKKAALIR